MVVKASNADLVAQAQPTTQTSAQTAAQAAAQARDAQRAANKQLGDEIREQVRAQIAGAQSQGGHATVVPPVPAPPASPRTFTIRGPNGEQTIIGMPPADEIIPPQVVDISLAFFFTIAAIIIGLPIARAFARRMDRKSAPGQVSGEVSAQLAQLNQAVDAIALEVERISEGQRFTTRLLSEQRDAVRQTLPSAADR
jgi:hypothetical protein